MRTNRLFIQCLLWQEGQPPSLAFDKDSKAGRAVGNPYSEEGKKKEFQIVVDWRLCSWGSGRLANYKWGTSCDGWGNIFDFGWF